MSMTKEKRLTHVAKHLKMNNFTSFEALAQKHRVTVDEVKASAEKLRPQGYPCVGTPAKEEQEDEPETQEVEATEKVSPKIYNPALRAGLEDKALEKEIAAQDTEVWDE